MKTIKKIQYTLLLCIVPQLLMAQLVNNGASVACTSGTYLVLNDGGLINNGTFTNAAGTVKFTGTAASGVAGSVIPSFYNMELNKPGSTLQLYRNIHIGNELVFTSGLLNVDNHTITLSPSALLQGESETSRLTGMDGQIQITTSLNAPSAVNPGNLGAVITSAQNMGNTTISRGFKSQTGAGAAGSSILRYYDIVPSNNTALDATLGFTYFDAELNGLQENVLVFWKTTDNVNWFMQGATSSDMVANYFEKTEIADFSRWTLAPTTDPLPVHFVSFTATCKSNQAVLSWITAQEQNSSTFQIQRSDDGVRFTTIATLPAAQHSSTLRTYSYSDNNSLPGHSFYRIAEISADGSMQFTAIKEKQCGSYADELKAWPNPVHDNLFVQLSLSTSSRVAIRIVDSKGSKIHTQSSKLPEGQSLLPIDASRWANGVYTIVADWNNGTVHKTLKVVKL